MAETHECAPVEMCKSIGLNGGEMCLYDCALLVQPGSLKEDREISISVDNNQANFPPNLEAISVLFGFETSVKLYKPVIVTMKTWFRAFEGQKVPAVLSTKGTESDWTRVDIFIEKDNEVAFAVKDSCKVIIGVTPEQANNGEYLLFYDFYIQQNNGLIDAIFYLDLKSKREFGTILSREGYSPISVTNHRQICGSLGQKVTLAAVVTSPPKTHLTWVNRSSEFSISDVIQEKKQKIQFMPMPRFGDYDGLVTGKFLAKVDGQSIATTMFGLKWPLARAREGV